MADINLKGVIKQDKKAHNSSSAAKNAERGEGYKGDITIYLGKANQAKADGVTSREQINSKIREILTGANQTVSASAPNVSEGLSLLQQSGGLVGVDITSQAEEAAKNTESENLSSKNSAKNINIGIGGNAANSLPVGDSVNIGSTTTFAQNNANTTAAQTSPKAENATTSTTGTQTSGTQSSGNQRVWYGDENSQRDKDRKQITASNQQQAQEKIITEEKIAEKNAADNAVRNANKHSKSGSGMLTTTEKRSSSNLITGDTNNAAVTNSPGNIGENNDALNAIKEAVKTGDTQTNQDLTQIKNYKTQMANNSNQIQSAKNNASQLVNTGNSSFKTFVNKAEKASGKVSEANKSQNEAAELFEKYESLISDPLKKAGAESILNAAKTIAGTAFDTLGNALSLETSAIKDGTSAFSNFDSAKNILTNAQTKYATPQTGLASKISNLANKIKSDNTNLYAKVQSEVANIRNNKNTTSSNITQNSLSGQNNSSNGIKFGQLLSGQTSQFGLA